MIWSAQSLHLGGSRLSLYAFALSCLLWECICFNLIVDSPYHQVEVSSTPKKFLCQANGPLVGCQVKHLRNNILYELSKGMSSQNYTGTGLESGQCGIVLDGFRKYNEYAEYGCRARALMGTWQYDTTVISTPESGNHRVLPIVTGPRTVIADPGSDVKFTFVAGERLTKCYFKFPGYQSWISNGSQQAYSVDNSKLAGGSCQLTLLNVQPNSSGIITFEARAKNGIYREVLQLTTLIVKMAPSAPALSLSKADGVYNEGDIMEASCQVGPARPVAQITLLLNNEVIPGEDENMADMPWEFEAAGVTRMMNRKLSIADDGKELVCRVSHVALPQGVTETKKKITVQRVNVAPGASALSLSKADDDYNEGDIMEASCKVGPARPAARITWLLNDDVILSEAEDFSTYPSELNAVNATRKLSWRLSILDDGKELACRALHVALPGGMAETKKKISVRRFTVVPSAPALSLSKADGVYNEGDVIEASCQVGPARPLARITWLLDDDVIQGEMDKPNEPFIWRWEIEAANVTDSLARKLSIADDGKELVCRAYHIGLDQGWIETRTNITVQPITDSAFLASYRVTWFSFGVVGSLLVVAAVVAALLVHARASEKWCFTRPGTVRMEPVLRQSNKYERGLEMCSAPSERK